MATRSFRVFDLQSDRLTFPFKFNEDERTPLREMMAGNGNVTRDDLRRVALWKLNRVIDVSDHALELLRRIAVADDLTVDSQLSRDTISALRGGKGIGFPMASSFLKFLRPDVFPIIDVRAYRALMGIQLSKHSYTMELYLDYAARLGDIAKTNRIPLCEVDEQLYCFDKEHNKAIVD